MKKFEKEYQLLLEAKALAEDPQERLKEENSHLREAVGRLEHENECLAQELVASKINLREEMDKVRLVTLPTPLTPPTLLTTPTAISSVQFVLLPDQLQYCMFIFQCRCGICVYNCVCVCVCVRACMHAYVHACMCVCVCAHTVRICLCTVTILYYSSWLHHPFLALCCVYQCVDAAAVLCIVLKQLLHQYVEAAAAPVC